MQRPLASEIHRLVQREHDVGSKSMSGNPRLAEYESGGVIDTQHSSPLGNESAPPCSLAANHGDDMVRLYEHCRADARTIDNHSHI